MLNHTQEQKKPSFECTLLTLICSSIFILNQRRRNFTAFIINLTGMQSGTIFGSQPYDLPLNETTTPQYLKSLGYTTPGVGITEPTDFHHQIQVSLLKSLWQMEQLTK